jgi:small GTP-binding protein
MSQRRKIIVLGDIGVGKTSIIRRFVLGRMDGTYKGTIGFDLYTYRIEGLGADKSDAMPVVIWDTDGNAGLNIVRQDALMGGTACALFICDVTRPETLTIMVELVRSFQSHHAARPAIMIGNKVDLLDGAAWTPPDGVRQLVDLGVPLVPASALTGHAIVAAFQTAGDAILRRGI